MTGKMGGQRGMTPRHSVLSPDGPYPFPSPHRLPCNVKLDAENTLERYLYVNSELESKLLIFDTASLALVSATDITPPHLAPSVRSLLLSADFYAHPIHTRTLYVSLRGTKRLDKMAGARGADVPNPMAGPAIYTSADEANLVLHGPPAQDMPKGQHARGDSMAVILLSDDGSQVQSIQHVQTGLDWPRGMRVSDDGRYLAVAGEFGEGGVEVYEISGERGEVFTLVARDESVKNVNCVLWL